MYDLIEISKNVELQVCDGNKRKYYRFRPAQFYGGIATADCLGCNLRCVYCWAFNVINKVDKVGNFYAPEEVARKLISIARKHKFDKIRISGNEPTMAKKHLLLLIDKIPCDILFILETNGILIGYDENYAKNLARFSNLHVRVSLKGSNAEEFAKFTNAKPEFFNYQLKALENLVEHGVSCHPAIISIAKDLEDLKKELAKINPKLPDSLEIEELIVYPAVIARLRKLNIGH